MESHRRFQNCKAVGSKNEFSIYKIIRRRLHNHYQEISKSPNYIDMQDEIIRTNFY